MTRYITEMGTVHDNIQGNTKTEVKHQIHALQQTNKCIIIAYSWIFIFKIKQNINGSCRS